MLRFSKISEKEATVKDCIGKRSPISSFSRNRETKKVKAGLNVDRPAQEKDKL